MKSRKVLLTNDSFVVVLYSITFSSVELYVITHTSEPVNKLIRKWHRKNHRYNVMGYTNGEVASLVSLFKNNNIQLEFETELWLAKHDK